MSNRLFQGVVHQMRDVINRVIGVVDETAAIIACSDLSKVGLTNEFIALDLSDSHDTFIRDGYTYKPFGPHIKPDYAVFVEGTDESASKYAQLLAISLSSIKQYYDEKYDRNNFVKNVVLDNILPGDIYIKARELHFNADATRVAFLIRVSGNGDVLDPDGDAIAIGSGGYFALAAARAYLDAKVDWSAEEIAKKSVSIAADICVYTNHNIITEVQDARA